MSFDPYRKWLGILPARPRIFSRAGIDRLDVFVLVGLLILHQTVVSAQDEPSVVAFSAVTISIDAEGKGLLTVDSRSIDESHKVNPLTGEPISIPAFGKTEVRKFAPDRLYVRYDFSKFGSIDELKNPFLGEDDEKLFSELRIDGDEGVLVLQASNLPRSSFTLPRAVIGPVNVRILLSAISDGLTELHFHPGPDRLFVSLNGEDSIKDKAGTVTVSLIQNEKTTNLIKIVQLDNKRNEYPFVVPKKMLNQRTAIRIGRVGDVPVAIPMIDVIGKFPPSFGMKLETKGNKVLVKMVFSSGAADKAGVKVGDVLLSINGETVKEVDKALGIFANCQLDKDAELLIDRFGKKRSVQVSPQ